MKNELPEPNTDRMPEMVARYEADWNSLQRRFTAPGSPRRRDRLRRFLTEWQAMLDAIPFDALTRSDQVDWVLLSRLLEQEALRLEREERQFEEVEPLLPFAAALIGLEEDRRELKDVEASSVARLLAQAVEAMTHAQARLKAELKTRQTEIKVQNKISVTNFEDIAPHWKPTVANRAAGLLDKIREMLANWFGFYHAYDPLFTWWVEKPYRALNTQLEEFSAFVRKEIVGVEDEDAIIGDPLGRDALLEELNRALIPYSPEELIAIGRKEMNWCLREMHRASEELGFGEDWRAAIEHVKTLHVAPGQQPALVRKLAREAEAYVQEKDLVTVPPLAVESWRMEMMSPEGQKVNPFFLGGEEIIVSFPTNDMEDAQKRMSLRGNNRHFARATVQHELIPGHHLQMFSQERFRPYRRIFYTPFWTEGWTLHWEMLLWDLGFAQTPEDRIGMLFWRMHRCARVFFSLSFHLGQMSPHECVQMLVNDVGHEPDNAIAEVRRSFGGEYDPLYQCAYLIGGLQVRALHGELVKTGQMTHREFHDKMLRGNCMPIAVLRALLTNAAIEREFANDWRFYADAREDGRSSAAAQSQSKNVPPLSEP